MDVDWDVVAGSLVRDEVSRAAFAGSGVYARLHVDTLGVGQFGILAPLLWHSCFV